MPDTRCDVYRDIRDELTESAAIDLLVDVISAPTTSDASTLLVPLSGASVGRLMNVARANGVEAWLAACAPSDVGIWSPLGEQRSRFSAARMRTSVVLDEISSLLACANCPWVVLKGPALAHDVYPRPDLRFSVDLDVLVGPESFERALCFLQTEGGFDLVDRNWPLIARLRPGQLRLRSPRGVIVDLHWSVINDLRLRCLWHMPTSRLLARMRRLDPHGIPALHPVDQLVHLGVHGAQSGANRLMWLLDADLAARRIDDWSEVVFATDATRTGGAVAMVLGRAQQVWKTPVPRDVLHRMAGGRAWPAVNRLIDRTATYQRGDAPTIARSWARSVRATQWQTAVEFARHGVAWYFGGRPSVREDLSHNDVGDPRSPLFLADDPAARSSYFDSVASRVAA